MKSQQQTTAITSIANHWSGPIYIGSRVEHNKPLTTPGIVTAMGASEYGPWIQVDNGFSDYAGQFRLYGHATKSEIAALTIKTMIEAISTEMPK